MDNLFQYGDFISTAGKSLKWKIECDAISDESWESIAKIIADKIDFCQAISVPRGGDKLASYLSSMTDKSSSNILIVDDVLTTGKSMEDMRNKLINSGVGIHNISGFVLFARNECPSWIDYVFSLNQFFK